MGIGLNAKSGSVMYSTGGHTRSQVIFLLNSFPLSPMFPMQRAVGAKESRSELERSDARDLANLAVAFIVGIGIA